MTPLPGPAIKQQDRLVRRPGGMLVKPREGTGKVLRARTGRPVLMQNTLLRSMERGAIADEVWLGIARSCSRRITAIDR